MRYMLESAKAWHELSGSGQQDVGHWLPLHSSGGRRTLGLKRNVCEEKSTSRNAARIKNRVLRQLGSFRKRARLCRTHISPTRGKQKAQYDAMSTIDRTDRTPVKSTSYIPSGALPFSGANRMKLLSRHGTNAPNIGERS